VALNNPKPMYTPDAMLRRIQGDVTLSCIVLKTATWGTATSPSRWTAISLVWTARRSRPRAGTNFKPATLKGEPVAMQVNIILTFTMR
jgi:hypothetical protein